ncbi:hypothetical protein RHMOL_Rhmol09G0067600 [Rhododendron molle]|uniref:Uncharacterized protein n=1 Tax=Rhododendron molle TaxID=49168 RepID=A0ACC0MC95_RHOML|nr:hypothetical protein RHMOL_Rhmol09G0067600 [Rhododendron molle]
MGRVRKSSRVKLFRGQTNAGYNLSFPGVIQTIEERRGDDRRGNEEEDDTTDGKNSSVAQQLHTHKYTKVDYLEYDNNNPNNDYNPQAQGLFGHPDVAFEEALRIGFFKGDKDKKIEFLIRELRRQDQLCAAYREKLLKFLTSIKEQTDQLSSKIQDVVENVRKVEVEMQQQLPQHR